jgi:hypothetical protein
MKGTSYKQYNEGRLTELVTSCVKNCLPNHVIDGKIQEKITQGAGHMQLLDDLQEKGIYWKLKRNHWLVLSEKRALDETMDLLQDRLRNEYACYTPVLSATGFLTRHI